MEPLHYVELCYVFGETVWLGKAVHAFILSSGLAPAFLSSGIAGIMECCQAKCGDRRASRPSKKSVRSLKSRRGTNYVRGLINSIQQMTRINAID